MQHTTETSSAISIRVVIVSYNTKVVTLRCLQSLYDRWITHSPHTIRVSVVDNASQDETSAAIQANFPQVEIRVLSKNRGYAAANNICLRTTQETFVLLLNSDTYLQEHHNLDDLLAFAQSPPQQQTAVWTPKVVLESGALDPACHRGEPTLWASLAYFLKLERLFPRSKVFGQYHMGWLDMHVAHQIAACSGAAMLVRTAAIRQVGIFDEQFFMYAEDLDWCRRFREANWQVWYVPQASVTHIKYQSGLAKPNTTNISQTRHYFYQTMLQYFEKHSAAHTPRIISMMVRTALRYKQGGA